VDADVREVEDRTVWSWWLINARTRAFGIDGMDLPQQRRAAHRKRHGMLPGVARFQMHHLIVMVAHGPLVLVYCEPVMVLRMVVIRVRVDVQRRDLAAGRGQDEPEQDRHDAMHSASVSDPHHGRQTGAQSNDCEGWFSSGPRFRPVVSVRTFPDTDTQWAHLLARSSLASHLLRSRSVEARNRSTLPTVGRYQPVMVVAFDSLS
jgi:hypothetical protein